MTALLAVLIFVVSACDREPGETGDFDTTAVYEQGKRTSADGTGRLFMGREIARVTGVGREEWLERPERETEELPNRVVRALELRATDAVADIGAGTGYFTFRISPLVPEGRVFAVDIESEMLETVRDRMAQTGISNIVPVLGTTTDPNLPADSIDAALIVFTYTQFSNPFEMMVNIRKSLKPGGRVVLVEYRGEDPTIPASSVYTITEEQARRELAAAGLVWRETRDILPQHHFMVFARPVE